MRGILSASAAAGGSLRAQPLSKPLCGFLVLDCWEDGMLNSDGPSKGAKMIAILGH